MLSNIIDATEQPPLELHALKNQHTLSIEAEEDEETTTKQLKKRQIVVKQQQMEMDVSTPEMLIFDRDDRKKIQQQQENNNNKKQQQQFVVLNQQQKLCFEKTQIFYSIPIIFATIILFTILLTIAIYRCCLDAKTRQKFSTVC